MRVETYAKYDLAIGLEIRMNGEYKNRFTTKRSFAI